VLLAAAHDERWQVYVAALLLGTGIGLAFASMVNLIIENVGPAETGVATGVNSVARTVGGAFGGAVVASILAATVSAGYPSAHGYTVAFVACATALILGAAVGLAIPQRRPADAFVRHEAGDLPSA
jgi:MFS family permease